MCWKGGGGGSRETIDVAVVWAGETTVELWCWRQENSRIVVVVVVEKNNRTVAALEGKH